jgi:hypothetical protein
MQNKIMEKELQIHQKTKRELVEALAELKGGIISMKHEVLHRRIARKRSKLVAMLQ